MNRCPTCKTEARSSAKFCTFCGTPLSPEEAEPQALGPAQPLATGVLEIPSSNDANRWIARPETGAPNGEESRPGEQDRLISTTWPSDAQAEAVPDDGEQEQGGRGWPNSASDPSTGGFAAWGPSSSSPRDEPLAAPDVANGIVSAPTSIAVMPAGWSSVPSEAATVPVAAGDEVPVAADEPRAELAMSPLADEGTPSDWQSDVVEIAPADPSASPSPVALPESSTNTLEASGGTGPAPFLVQPVADVEASDAGRRAADLLDELRGLLPALGATRLQPGALADRLEAVLVADGEVPDGLRAALEAARANPRDLDIVLDLTRRIDDVASLIDRHERLVDAVRSAVRSLRYGDVE